MTTLTWYWREVGYDCATMMLCCIVAMPFLVIDDLMEARREE